MGDEGQAVDKPVDDMPSVAASSGEPTSAPVDSVINRRSRWISSLAALRYVNSVSRDEEIKTRDSDRATAISLLVMCIAALICLVVPELEAHRVGFVIGA